MDKLLKRIKIAGRKLKKNYSRGMSLMEVVIWSGLVAIMAGIVGFSAVKFWNTAKKSTAKSELGIYATALLQYYSIEGTYPSEDEGLEILYKKGYLEVQDAKDLNDPWGNPYVYTVLNNGEGFKLTSLGSDKQEGGEGNNADIARTGGNVGDDVDIEDLE
jgi:general secretion pathway protein G